MEKNIRNIIAYVMTSAAIMLMLGGSIFPHHHDEHGICFDLFEDGHGGCEQDAPLSHTDKEAQCTLSINYYPAQKQDNVICGVCEEGDGHFHNLELALDYQDFAELLYIHSLEFSSKSKISLRDEFVKELLHVSSIGLRAPPSVVA